MTPLREGSLTLNKIGTTVSVFVADDLIQGFFLSFFYNLPSYIFGLYSHQRGLQNESN